MKSSFNFIIWILMLSGPINAIIKVRSIVIEHSNDIVFYSPFYKNDAIRIESSYNNTIHPLNCSVFNDSSSSAQSVIFCGDVQFMINIERINKDLVNIVVTKIDQEKIVTQLQEFQFPSAGNLYIEIIDDHVMVKEWAAHKRSAANSMLD